MNRKLKTHIRKAINGNYASTMCNMEGVGFWMHYRIVETWNGVPIKDRCKNCQRIIKLMEKENKMINKEDAEQFIFKVDTEGLSYAAYNYAVKNTGDEKFHKLVSELVIAQANMEAYIQELRDTYDIEYS